MKRNTSTDAPSFWGIARYYLHEYMPRVRDLSPRTIEAYRISLECFVRYLVDERHIQRKDLGFEHFERDVLKDWLCWMREAQRYQPKTLNLRLTAVRAFLRYAAQEELRLVELHEATMALKAPTAPKKPIEYLEQDQMAAILAAYEGSSSKSRRNRMLLILLYESAARVSEITALTLGDLSLAKPAHLILTGKGSKSRVVPLGEQTTEHLQVFLTEFHPRRPICRPHDRCSTAPISGNPPGSRRTALPRF